METYSIRVMCENCRTMKEIGLLYKNEPICIFNDNDGNYYLGEWKDYGFGRNIPHFTEGMEKLTLEQVREKTGLNIVIRPNTNQHIILHNKTEKEQQ